MKLAPKAHRYWYEWGYFLLESGDARGAKIMLNQAVKFAPSNLLYREMRAEIHDSLGFAQDALSDINLVIAKGDTADARGQRASVLIDLGNFEQAADDIEAMTAYPDYADYRGGLLVKLDYFKGNYKPALERAAALVKTSSENHFARYWLARAQHEMRQYDEAIENFTVLAAVWKTSGVIRVDRAKAYFAAGKREEAYDGINNAMTFLQSENYAREVRADFYTGDARWKDAIDDYDKLLSLNRTNASHLVSRANAKWNLGRSGRG